VQGSQSAAMKPRHSPAPFRAAMLALLRQLTAVWNACTQSPMAAKSATAMAYAPVARSKAVEAATCSTLGSRFEIWA
jgi:hypothetical protein